MIIEQKIKHHGGIHAETLRITRDLILSSHPGIQLKLKYTLPFFTLKKDLCYIDIQKNKPILGVINGINLTNVRDLLDFTGRKYVGHYSLLNLDEKRLPELQFIIDEMIVNNLSR